MKSKKLVYFILLFFIVIFNINLIFANNDTNYSIEPTYFQTSTLYNFSYSHLNFKIGENSIEVKIVDFNNSLIDVDSIQFFINDTTIQNLNIIRNSKGVYQIKFNILENINNKTANIIVNLKEKSLEKNFLISVKSKENRIKNITDFFINYYIEIFIGLFVLIFLIIIIKILKSIK